MPRGQNAQLAVDQYLGLLRGSGWTKASAWHGIARLLLSCDVWESGGYRRLRTLSGKSNVPDVVVYRERNDFRVTRGAPNLTVSKAEHLTKYLAQELGVEENVLCEEIGMLYRLPEISDMQPHNIVGHAFRSICVEILKKFGDRGVVYEEEVDPSKIFPGWRFDSRSKKAKFDILAKRGGVPVALISVRWRFRHDRVDVPDEMRAYGPAARNVNRNCALYALVGEFSPVRLEKLLAHSPPMNNPILDATIHFSPDLIGKGLEENGRLAHLRSLEWLIDQTHLWK
jgi:hypothetical protein